MFYSVYQSRFTFAAEPTLNDLWREASRGREDWFFLPIRSCFLLHHVRIRTRKVEGDYHHSFNSSMKVKREWFALFSSRVKSSFIFRGSFRVLFILIHNFFYFKWGKRKNVIVSSSFYRRSYQFWFISIAILVFIKNEKLFSSYPKLFIKLVMR